MSGSSYPTSNLYFLQVWRIECLLNENLESEDSVISDMCIKMKQKFDKYWKEYSITLALGAVLDPRIKFSFLRFCFNKIDPYTCEEKLATIKSKLYRLFAEYDKSRANHMSTTTTSFQVGSSSQAQQTLRSGGKRVAAGNMGLGKGLGIDATTLDVS